MWYRPPSALMSKRLTMSARRAPIVCNRDSGTSSPRPPARRQAGRFEANDVIPIIARATGKFGEPLSGLIVYERLGPRAAGAAAALQETAKLIARWQCPGLELCGRCQEL